MKHLGFRKRGRAPVQYELVKVGLQRFLRIVDKGGIPVAVVEIELETLEQILKDYF